MLRENGLQRLIDECRLARAADARYEDEPAEGEADVDMLEVITGTAG